MDWYETLKAKAGGATTPRKDREHSLQCACVRWFRLQYPTLLLFAVPNGGARSATTGARLKAEGVVAGVPDLFLAHPVADKAGLFIEMKTEIGRLSKVQKSMFCTLYAEKYGVICCHSLEEFISAINNYLTNGSTLKTENG